MQVENSKMHARNLKVKEILLFLTPLAIIFLSACAVGEAPVEAKEWVDLFLAVQNNDVSLCERISTEQTKTSCFYRLASRNADSSLCPAAIEYCPAAITAIASKDSSICEQAKEEHHYACYDTYAKKMRDPVACGKIQKDFLVSICYQDLAIITRNPALCDNVREDFKHDCQIVASLNGDRCKDLESSAYEFVCYENAAVSSQNSKFCDKIKDKQERVRCHLYTKNDISLEVLMGG